MCTVIGGVIANQKSTIPQLSHRINYQLSILSKILENSILVSKDKQCWNGNHVMWNKDHTL